MNTETRCFLRKFLAAIALQGIGSIPFAGESYNNGIQAVQIYLRKKLDRETYNNISDMFIKTPVVETYDLLRDLFMELNGSEIKFNSLENPTWTTMVINLNEIKANYILEDQTQVKIDRDIVKESTHRFLTMAGA